ncbi:S-adenosylmethionine-dependent methyltransferase [Penicillium lividum]|nr:S-adenosylmethionine-dependent methyltransferase [Penicillium lividum]
MPPTTSLLITRLYLDGPFQPPITSLGDYLVDLYKHICPLDHAGDHGSQSERGVWYLLEMRAYRRTTQSLCQHMLFCDGCKMLKPLSKKNPILTLIHL